MSKIVRDLRVEFFFFKWQKICRIQLDVRGEVRPVVQPQLYRVRCTRGSEASWAVHDCSRNQIKLYNVSNKCFDHKPLLRKDCSWGPHPNPRHRPHTVPSKDDTNRQCLSSLRVCHRPKSIFLCSVSYSWQKADLFSCVQRLQRDAIASYVKNIKHQLKV